ncbi:MAG: hypothetical protein Q9214_000388, partial [Letrouitia sp. 1 TL-2023]
KTTAGMSTFHRLVSRKDKDAHGAPHRKVMSSPASQSPSPRSDSFASIFSSTDTFSAFNGHNSSSSASSLSLAFPLIQNAKKSPEAQATEGAIESSTANTCEHLLLQPKQTAGFLHSWFPEEKVKLSEKDENAKVTDQIKALSARLLSSGYRKFQESDISDVLTSSSVNGDVEKAYNLITLLQESKDGIIKPYDQGVKLLGAVNREGVTCYLDSLLFAMFARQSCFEAMLYNNFNNEKKEKLATLIRLWVNMLRVGKLITTDMTKQLQSQLAECGWQQAFELSQQDASEAFSFITEVLELPLLTLKMDIFHNGREEINDDHKFINERLLEVSIPEDPEDGSVITLEDCLETYFNNRVEVRRYLERRDTLNSMKSRSSFDHEKASFAHIETVEYENSQPSTPSSPLPPALKSPRRLTNSRARAPSIIQESYISEKGNLTGSPAYEPLPQYFRRRRAGSVRKEVMMPAWQFFQLIRICLKRYWFLPNGKAMRRGTHIDIPTEIGLPQFISDDAVAGDGSVFGNFKLSLQSVVCHRGHSVHSGHYVSIVRNHNPQGFEDDNWMRLDDLAKERVAEVDVGAFLKKETPYLLFYQVLPIDGEPGNSTAGDHPPAYSQISKSDFDDLGISCDEKLSSGLAEARLDQKTVDTRTAPSRLDGRPNSMDQRRQSAVSTDTSCTTSKEESQFRTSFDADGRARATTPSRDSKGNPPATSNGPYSQSNDKGFSASMSRLTGRLLKDRTDPSISASGASTNARPSLEIVENPRHGDKRKLRKDKHKSKAQSHQHLTKGKPRSTKPDRECVTM